MTSLEEKITELRQTVYAADKLAELLKTKWFEIPDDTIAIHKANHAKMTRRIKTLSVAIRAVESMGEVTHVGKE